MKAGEIWKSKETVNKNKDYEYIKLVEYLNDDVWVVREGMGKPNNIEFHNLPDLFLHQKTGQEIFEEYEFAGNII